MRMSKITISQLKKHLENYSKEELSKEIIELFIKLLKVKEFYQAKLSGSGELELREKYKKIIKNEFFPERGFGKLRLSVAKKAVSDFKKLSNNIYFIVDLMIYYVEMGVDFTNEYGDIDEQFYNSMENMYETVAKFAVENKIENNYIARFKKIVEDTNDTGWGFHDMLEDLFYKYFQCYN
ncbi:MAG: hypothetical protein C0412_16470 [Flavobacterium sp.]|nr:hypothetical protein [Flavobacterium sp.]